MKLTHDVLIDLLSLERAGEASTDTRTLLAHYREHDSNFARLASDSESLALELTIPEPQLKEKEMETFQQAQKALYIKAFVVVTSIVGVLAALVLALGAVLLILG